MASRSRIRLVASRTPAAAKLDDHDGPGFERAKKSFLAAMSHELRTPLNAIIGFAEIMDAEILGPMPVAQYREYVSDILASSRHLLRIIENVLEISNAEAGELVLVKREVELAELVGDALAPLKPSCIARGIRVSLELPEHLVIRVDPDRMKRAIGGLLSNAVKFSAKDGGVRIGADICARDRVTLRIIDNGIGMNPAMIERAFAPFVQLADKLSRPYEGAGLGLPLARLLAELHGGSVRIESRPGRGTTAILELPAYPAEAAAEA